MKVKKWVTLGTILTLSVTLAACGNKSASDEGKGESAKKEFTYVELQEMPTADPSLSTDVVSAVMLGNCYEGLYRLGEKNEVIPAGAKEKAEVSEDGKTYVFKLRKNAKWSNGDPVTAKDYVYSWQRTVDPKTKSEYAYIFSGIANADAITNGEKDKAELGIKAVDDYTLEVKLERAIPYFDYLMAFANFVPQNQKIVEKYGDKYTTSSDKAVYNGAFKLAKFDGPGSDTDWAYVKNDKYWNKKQVKLDQINVNVVKEASTALNLYQDNQADDVTLTGELAKQMKDDKEFKVEMQGGPYYLEMNQIKEDSPFKNVNLRKAISYSIDRDALVNKVIGDGSTAATGLTPEKMVFSKDGKQDFGKETKDYIVYDKAKAKEYWEKAKKELNITSLKFGLMGSDDANSKKVMEYLQSSITETLDGVDVDVSPVPFSVRLDRSNKGDFDVVLSGWNADYPDPSSFLDLFKTGNSYNRGHYSNPKYDELVKAASETDALDPEKRWQDMLDAENLIMDEVGVVPLYQKAEAHMRRSDLKGVIHHPTGFRFDYSKADIK